MKTKTSLFLLGIVSIFITLSSCKSKKPIAKVTDSEEITVPFSTPEYQSDKDNFRASASGHSPDLETSKKIAMNNAEADLSGKIKTVMSTATKQYTNQATVADKQDYENKFEEQIWAFVDQTLNSVKVLGEKVYRDKKDGSYTYWVAIQESKDDLLAGVNTKISANENLKLNYDEKKFGEEVDKEMQKMKENQDQGK